MFQEITANKDSFFIRYATDTIAGSARWFLQPQGKFNSPAAALFAFKKARKELTSFVQNTIVDLRQHFTYRAPVSNIKDVEIGQIRDLHQLLLTGIAHTDRHINQIKQIKLHPGFP